MQATQNQGTAPVRPPQAMAEVASGLPKPMLERSLIGEIDLHKTNGRVLAPAMGERSSFGDWQLQGSGSAAWLQRAPRQRFFGSRHSASQLPCAAFDHGSRAAALLALAGRGFTGRMRSLDQATFSQQGAHAVVVGPPLAENCTRIVRLLSTESLLVRGL